MSLPALLGAVAGAGLAPLLDAGGVERAADDLVADARQVSNAPGSDQDDRVLLQVVSDARDVRRDLDAGGQADTGDLPQGRVRLLRGRGVDARADPPPLRRSLEGGSLGLLPGPRTALAHELLDRGHGPSRLHSRLVNELGARTSMKPDRGPGFQGSKLRRAQVVPWETPWKHARCRARPPSSTRTKRLLGTKRACQRNPWPGSGSSLASAGSPAPERVRGLAEGRPGHL